MGWRVTSLGTETAYWSLATSGYTRLAGVACLTLEGALRAASLSRTLQGAVSYEPTHLHPPDRHLPTAQPRSARGDVRHDAARGVRHSRVRCLRSDRAVRQGCPPLSTKTANASLRSSSGMAARRSCAGLAQAAETPASNTPASMNHRKASGKLVPDTTNFLSRMIFHTAHRFPRSYRSRDRIPSPGHHAGRADRLFSPRPPAARARSWARSRRRRGSSA